jgi:hypothetical protein
MVCFENGSPTKDKYRRFKIREVDQIDDFAMMQEVIKRHYSRKMNEKQAMNEGLSFTGIYSWDKEKVQQRIKEERIKRPKARIVQVNTDNGYSAYADNKYDAYRTIEDTARIVENVDSRLAQAKKKYEEKVYEIRNNYCVALERKEKAELAEEARVKTADEKRAEQLKLREERKKAYEARRKKLLEEREAKRVEKLEERKQSGDENEDNSEN